MTDLLKENSSLLHFTVNIPASNNISLKKMGSSLRCQAFRVSIIQYVNNVNNGFLLYFL